jgi:hypothetical protein
MTFHVRARDRFDDVVHAVIGHYAAVGFARDDAQPDITCEIALTPGAWVHVIDDLHALDDDAPAFAEALACKLSNVGETLLVGLDVDGDDHALRRFVNGTAQPTNGDVSSTLKRLAVDVDALQCRPGDVEDLCANVERVVLVGFRAVDVRDARVLGAVQFIKRSRFVPPLNKTTGTNHTLDKVPAPPSPSPSSSTVTSSLQRESDPVRLRAELERLMRQQQPWGDDDDPFA